MNKRTEAAIVRIYRVGNTSVVGIGFLFQDNLLLTCCHVINAALGQPGDSISKPSEIISVDFPFLARGEFLEAIVAEWFPKEQDGGDVAILRLVQKRPANAKPAKLLMLDDYSEHLFSVYGCPPEFQKTGRWAEGQLQQFLPNGRLQAVGTTDLAYFVDSGFSGGPVWNMNVHAVTGIVVSIDRSETKLQASIIPTNTIKQIYSSLPLLGPIVVAYSGSETNSFAIKLEAVLSKEQFLIRMIKVGKIGTEKEAQALEEILHSMSVLVLILSPDALKSKSFERIWNEALLLGKSLVPIVALKAEIPSVLQVLSYIDFQNEQEFDANMRILVNKLRISDEDEPPELYERLSGIRIDRSHEYPVVIGQRLTTTVDYFQNRQHQIQTIGETLLMPGTRIISVTGAAGIGKTALVSKFLYDLENNIWPHTDKGRKVDGILYLSHRTVGITLERLFLDCAEMLGGDRKNLLHSIWSSQKLDLTEKVTRLLELINEGTYIILLDNVEDLLDEKGNLLTPELSLFFQQSLATPGNARLLITSREPINFKHADAPLDKRIVLDRGLDVEYGITMLRQSDPSGLYGILDAKKETLAKIVNMVHGVPRALEVFVGIVKDEKSALFTLEEVVQQFYSHPMIEKELVIEGYRRLDVDAKRVIQGLAIFGRPVPVKAVKFLLEPFLPHIDTTNIILRLIRIHMISVVDKEKKLVALHPMDRDYAYLQIEKTP